MRGVWGLCAGWGGWGQGEANVGARGRVGTG